MEWRKKKNITKADFYNEVRENPSFVDFLIDSVFVDVSTITVMQLKGLSQMALQRRRDSGKINAKRKRGNKRTYHYNLSEVIMDKWNSEKRLKE